MSKNIIEVKEEWFEGLLKRNNKAREALDTLVHRCDADDFNALSEISMLIGYVSSAEYILKDK